MSITTLTRVLIDPARREVRKALASREVLHAIIERAFGPEHAGRILWRLDRMPDGLHLLVVGVGQPDVAVLVAELGGKASDIRTLAYDRFLSTLDPGTEWRFRLRANPTRAVRIGGRQTRRQAIRSEPEQVEWLVRQGTRFGFLVPDNRLDVPEVVVRERGIDEFRRRSDTVTLATVTFDGVLRVTDPDALRTALTTGIGRGKAYGCGLLTLAPLAAAG